MHLKVGAWAPAALLFCCFSVACAPVEGAGPAVSAPNGKIEFDAGALSIPSSFVGRVAGTLTLPVGDTFGVQVDASVGTAGGMASSAAFHLFTRDPERYLFGGTLGMISMPGATVMAAGPEAELYFGRWTLEAWGGASLVRPSAGPDRTAAFGMMDVALYPQPNLRLSTGFTLLDNFAALHFGGEYLFDETTVPLSIVADTRIGQDGSLLATVGLRGYFGAPHKSLVDRHRQDDPWDRGGSLFTAVGGATTFGPGAASPAAQTSSTTTGDDKGDQGTPPPDDPTPTSGTENPNTGDGTPGGDTSGTDGCDPKDVGDGGCFGDYF
jgi:hypothetical protein